MDPSVLQRAWATWQHSQQQPPASADSILTFSSEAAASEKAAALAAGYFPVPPPPRAEHMHPFGGMAGGEEDVGLELLMTALASLVIVGVWVLGILLWYKHCVERPPRLFCGKGRLIKEVIEACPSLQRPYRPPIWCLSPWAQAGVSLQRVAAIRAQISRSYSSSLTSSSAAAASDPCSKLPSSPSSMDDKANEGRRKRRRGQAVERLPLTKEVVVLSDGQEVGLHWFPLLLSEQAGEGGSSSSSGGVRAVALLLHGVTGSSHDHYELMERLASVGILGVGFDRRGHGGLPLRRPRFNTTGDQDDLKEVIDLICARFPGHPLFAVGYSAGSSLLGRYLGEQGEGSHIDGAVLVSPGFDMEEAILMGHFHPLADYYLTQVAKGLFLDGIDKVGLTHQQTVAVRRMRAARSMREFHLDLHHFTGHGDAAQYFEAQNPGPLLKDIARPTLFINSHDDMMFPRALIRPWTWLAEANPNVALAQTRWGGHCCFYEGALSLQPASWAEKVVEEFLTALVAREAPRMIERRLSRTASRPQLLAPSFPKQAQQSQQCPPSSSRTKLAFPSPPSPSPYTDQEGEGEEEGWMLHNLSSHGSTASCSSLSSSSASFIAWQPPSPSPPSAMAPPAMVDGFCSPPSPVPTVAAVPTRAGAMIVEEEEEEGRKEALKAVMTRAGLTGWGLFIVGVLGVLVSTEPFASAGAVLS